MPIMTHSACHSETTVSMTNSDTSFNNWRDFGSQRGSRYVTVRERGKHKANSVAGNGTPQPTGLPDDCVDEKATTLLSESESCAPPLSSSASVVSQFVGRLGASVLSLSSLRTVPSWRSSLVPDVQTTYAQIEPRYDSEDSDSTNHPHLSCGMTPNQYHSSGSQRHHTLRRRRHERRTRSSNNVLHAAISLPSVPARFPRAKTTTNRRHESDSSSGSSLNTYQSSFDGRVPFPSISEEPYPSPHSPDAVAVFQIPPDKGKAPPFDCFVKHQDIFEDEIQVIFKEEASDGTSTNMSTGATSVCPTSRQHSLLAPLRRRVSAVASSVIHTRRKFPTVFQKNRSPPNPIDDDDDEPVEYDIPCLAYITCLW